MRLSDLLGEGKNTAEISGLTSDSREVGPGFLFAALPGVKADGRQFIDSAIQKGANAVLAPKGTKVPEGITLIEDNNPRQRFAQLAARFYERQPDTLVAVTGTNGKTSTVNFCRQIWKAMGLSSASIGTLGVMSDAVTRPGSLTTPDPVTLHHDLAELESSGVTHLAVEASSHGLEQFRLDGVRVKAAAFSNLTRDHLDYHKTMENYLAAKMRLFTELLEPGAPAVINADIPEFEQIAQACKKAGHPVLSFGAKGKDIVLKDRKAMPTRQYLSLQVRGKKYDVELPLAGEYQVFNALCALGLVIAHKPDDHVFIERAVRALEKLEGVRGRLELAAHTASGAAIYVDYAHSPDGIENVLKSLRPHTEGKLHIVFGCGGDRDRGKRPEMAKIAGALADRVIVTDDNPRTEDPTAIRKEVMAGCPSATEIADRAEAIRAAIKGLQKGDVLVIAGKGHEQGQIVGKETKPFDDVTEAKKAVQEAKTDDGKKNHLHIKRG